MVWMTKEEEDRMLAVRAREEEERARVAENDPEISQPFSRDSGNDAPPGGSDSVSDQKQPMSGKKKLLYLVLAAMAFFFIGYNVFLHNTYDTPPNDEDEVPGANMAVPVLAFSDFNNNSYLLSDFYGKPTIVNIWATWCPPCLEELKVYDAAAAKYGERINFIMLNYADGQRETVASAKEYLGTQNFRHLAFYYDDAGDSASKLGFSGLPVNILMYDDGVSMTAFGGAMDAEFLEEQIQTLLSGRAANQSSGS